MPSTRSSTARFYIEDFDVAAAAAAAIENSKDAFDRAAS